MRKIAKFTISMSAAEFKDLESSRRRAGRTRSQFIRDAIAAWRHGRVPSQSVKEDQAEYGAPPASDTSDLMDMDERRRRAIAAAGKFRSGVVDLSAKHDRYLEEVFAEDSPTKEKA